ncbi:MAG: nuclear transport factor 2 family protein [Burkholderiaceae bacterium]
MNAAENKRILQAVFDELAKGNSRPFVDAMSDDFSWTIAGTGPWAGTWRGKNAVREELFAPLFAQFETQYTNTAQRLIAEDDLVVVECRGRVRTKNGKRYDNTYCYVCRIKAGKMAELTEYCDTQLIADVLTPPVSATA